MASLRALKTEEVANNAGYTHVYEVGPSDLTASASATSLTLTLFSNVGLGFTVERAAYEVPTAFTGHSGTLTAALKIASTDIIAATTIASTGSTRGDTVRTSSDAGDDITLVIAAGTSMLTTTAGKLNVFLKVSRPPRLN